MDPMGYIFGGLTGLPKPSIFLFGVSGKKSEETEGILNWETLTPLPEATQLPKEIDLGKWPRPLLEAHVLSNSVTCWYIGGYPTKISLKGGFCHILQLEPLSEASNQNPVALTCSALFSANIKIITECHRWPCPPTS